MTHKPGPVDFLFEDDPEGETPVPAQWTIHPAPWKMETGTVKYPLGLRVRVKDTGEMGIIRNEDYRRYDVLILEGFTGPHQRIYPHQRSYHHDELEEIDEAELRDLTR